MQYWASDYEEGCAPEILKRLEETNLDSHGGYGGDEISEEAKRKIRLACAKSDAEVHFLVGGTQTNATVIAAIAKPWQGVLSAESGHINCHEAGAVEYTGVKVLPLRGHDGGKIDASGIEEAVKAHFADEARDHIVEPGLVYLSHPTEYGALYTKAELSAISRTCRTYHLPLFLDGARLAYGLASPLADLTLPDIASLADVFSIGGTKCGALFGEAVVAKAGLLDHFFTQMKQHGALLAKGWLLALQFDTLFSDDLYLRLGRNANLQASLLRRGMRERGYLFHPETVANQIFVVLDNEKMERLSSSVRFTRWEALDSSRTVVRFATSWATTEEKVASLLEIL